MYKPSGNFSETSPPSASSPPPELRSKGEVRPGVERLLGVGFCLSGFERISGEADIAVELDPRYLRQLELQDIASARRTRLVDRAAVEPLAEPGRMPVGGVAGAVDVTEGAVSCKAGPDAEAHLLVYRL